LDRFKARLSDLSGWLHTLVFMNGTRAPEPHGRPGEEGRATPPGKPSAQNEELTAVLPSSGKQGPTYWQPQGPEHGQGSRPSYPTSSYPPFGPDPAQPSTYTGGMGAYGPPTGPAPGGQRPRRPAGIVVAAVLAGALAGIGSAAGYTALVEPDTTTSNTAPPTLSSTAGHSDAPAGSVEAVAAAVLPSVVKIDVAGPSGTGSGSGFILTADGTILTNNHVVAAGGDSPELAVSFNDGSTAPAEIVGTDPLTDLAVIKAEDVDGLTPARLGSSDSVDVGQQVVAVGSPFGLESTVTSGIVSALNRPVSTGDGGLTPTVFPAIQTDAAINPGNSGGALVNMRGEVIGINSAIRSAAAAPGGVAGSIGLGFAIPIDEAKPIADQLAAGETATHARLGVTVQTAANEDGLPGGAEVQSVEPGSGADQAGLQPGDVITKIDGTAISSSDAVVAMVRSYRPGDEVTLTVVRDGDEQEITVQLGSDEGDPNT
jgi:putative serine protease PepD